MQLIRDVSVGNEGSNPEGALAEKTGGNLGKGTRRRERALIFRSGAA